mmetsp:Transcript_6729/g.15523  ORF Transcript_6729/g.15523 Transcript_6729/m.15523 type:complete len:950 (-) Transcript_6729:93-2942(-)
MRHIAGLVLLCFLLEHAAAKDWAEHWCEINDCSGVKASTKEAETAEAFAAEVRIATRRYHATGEIRAIKSDAMKTAYWQYDGPVLDHPAFPGVANEHAERAERRNEAAAIAMRRTVKEREALGADFRPENGFLPTESHEAKALHAVEEEHAAVAVAKARFKHLEDEMRVPCQYDIGREKGTLSRLTTFPTEMKGCAAGSVWKVTDDGEKFNDAENPFHRTVFWSASVWKKTNGTHREWFEDVYQLPEGHFGPQSWKQIEAKRILPYKIAAPPPCAPGYGGAECKREPGAGADYVDEEETLPPWVDKKSVKTLVRYWKRHIKRNAAISGSATEPEKIAGGANTFNKRRNKSKKTSRIGERTKEGAKRGIGAHHEPDLEEEKDKKPTSGDKKQDAEIQRPMVSGVEKIDWDLSADGDDKMEVVGSEEDRWVPNPQASASGPWYGGWWVGIYGKNLGKGHGDLDRVLIGDVRCRREVWLSQSSVACMVPKGMGLEQTVTVMMKNKQQADLPAKFSYEPPEILSYNPRNGAVRGGQMVTINGKNFGHVDTSPVIYLAGRICIESFWVKDSQVLCRAPPGAGGHAYLHTVDVQLHDAVHVQDMPRKLKHAARAVKDKIAESVSQKPDLVVELINSGTSSQSSATSTDVSVVVGDSAIAEVLGPKKQVSSLSREERLQAEELAKRKREWNNKATDLMQKRAQDASQEESSSTADLIGYIETSVERDVQEWEKKKKAKEEKMRKKLEKQEALERQRLEEEKILQEKLLVAKKEQEKAQSKVQKSLNKFQEAQRRAKMKKLENSAQAALNSDKQEGAEEALKVAVELDLPASHDLVKRLLEKTGKSAEEWEGEREKRSGGASAAPAPEEKRKEEEVKEQERSADKDNEPKQVSKESNEGVAAKENEKTETCQGSAQECAAKPEDEDALPDLDLYAEDAEEAKKKGKRKKKKKGKSRR